MNDFDALTRLSAMAHKDRLALLKALVRAGPEGLLAGQMAEVIAASPSKTSFHLSTLAKAGLVSSRRRAREITYRVEYPAIGGLMRYILEDCCANSPAVAACCRPAAGCRDEG